MAVEGCSCHASGLIWWLGCGKVLSWLCAMDTVRRASGTGWLQEEEAVWLLGCWMDGGGRQVMCTLLTARACCKLCSCSLHSSWLWRAGRADRAAAADAEAVVSPPAVQWRWRWRCGREQPRRWD